MTERAAAGHEGADAEAKLVAELFEQHRTAVFAYVARLCGDKSLAEELTQEAFLKLFRTRHRLADVQNHRAWLFRVATNTCFSALRRRRFARLPWQEAETLAHPAGDIAEQVGTRDAVEMALASLPEPYRAALLLYSLHGFGVGEVAAILQISKGAVKTRVWRAKEMFQKAYESGRGP